MVQLKAAMKYGEAVVLRGYVMDMVAHSGLSDRPAIMQQLMDATPKESAFDMAAQVMRSHADTILGNTRVESDGNISVLGNHM